jgi:hypothetical protein
MGEIITWQVAMGGAATLAGVALVALAERRLAKAEQLSRKAT